MSNSGEKQLSMNLDQVDPNRGNPNSDDSDSYLEELYKFFKTTRGKVETRAEQTGVSVFTVLRQMGATEEQLERASSPVNVSPSMSKPETPSSSAMPESFELVEIPTSPVIGPTVDLGERALLLTTAFDELDAEVKQEQDENRKRSRYNRTGKSRRVSKKRQGYRDSARKAFHEAFDANGMVEAGEDPVEANYQELISSNDFNSRFLGAEKAHKRDQYRDKLKRQIK